MSFTFIIYNVILLFGVLFAYISERITSRSNHIAIVASFLVVFLFVGLRHYVGNDYEAYVVLFNAIRNGIGTRLEYGYFLINSMFTESVNGYKYVMLISSFITFFFLFKTFVKEQILPLGIFFVFAFELIFLINDQVRQGIAIAIFLYAIQFIENREFYKYSIIMIATGVLIHYSALIMLPAYFMYRKYLPTWVWCVAIILGYIVYSRGMFQNIFGNLISLIPFYGDRFGNETKHIVAIEKLGTGLAVLFWVIIGLYIALNQRKINRPVLVNLYLFGTVFFIVTLDFHVITRVAFYLVYIKVLVLPLYIKNENNWTLKLGVLAVALLFFELEVLLELGTHGGFPYKTIFE
ncbi:EpsG family protein [Winogradskyella sp. PG-2]|uniref:EpsG family protein n=1 Tax=Winogradskyella sp. PG-2 TaxID=754409 RepID=UPI0004586730|nr:EpsG family protein [Winogradskyella sp. PG-2]BAO75048.1 capsular polysaccharide biosynthesis protein [Winogradskyella sp. PG-2]